MSVSRAQRITAITNALTFIANERGSHGWVQRVTTTHLLRVMQVAFTERHSTLKCLHSLYENGTLARTGKGKYRWNFTPQGAEMYGLKDATTPTTDDTPTPPPVDDTPTPPPVDDTPDEDEDGEDGEVRPAVFQTVIDLAKMRRNILLVGPAGCGKTFLGSLVAKELDFKFGSISCTAGMSEVNLTGRGVPNISDGSVRFQSTDFLQCYENGGVFLLDEMDAADPNLMLVLNSAIANGYCDVPNRHDNPRAMRHENFVLISTANTFGHGADRTYVGRNQLDGATLDRYAIGTIECDYDLRVEKKLCPNDEIRIPLQAIRKKINECGLRRIMSTRFIEDAFIMSEAGWSLDKILNQFFSGWKTDDRNRVWNESMRYTKPRVSAKTRTDAKTPTTPVAASSHRIGDLVNVKPCKSLPAGSAVGSPWKVTWSGPDKFNSSKTRLKVEFAGASLFVDSADCVGV
jgi:hypothetical protein